MPRQIEGATKPKIFNTIISIANFEYNQNLPIGTLKFLIQSRNSKVDLKLCFTKGESNSKYITLFGGSAYYEDMVFVKPNFPISLYFQTDSLNLPVTIETIAWVLA
jgi:hypothetical protein